MVSVGGGGVGLGGFQVGSDVGELLVWVFFTWCGRSLEVTEDLLFLVYGA